ncbi:helix-turn-helix domain-containing protein [Palleronia caenipelagi]|uniref:Helix-turn-helix transcriptional regulator n=1 Tax=Palleronia caenipelagi TaxID=2489174 RepID=A0A547Q9I4_9RHOB|nr:helix-turn-helix transcriptional regulator [Palleronia caenipelagi]TRD23065.1 helix-turn-helix transcriptional regulator [Palleronia caenipelagi]
MTDAPADETQNWYSDESATFGDRLTDARRAVGMSQEELCRRLGIKLTTLEKWENDISEPRANRLSMLSGVLNVSLPWLITGDGEGISPPVDTADMDRAAVLADLRQMRAQLIRAADRMGRLEKRLREMERQ